MSSQELPQEQQTTPQPKFPSSDTPLPSSPSPVKNESAEDIGQTNSNVLNHSSHNSLNPRLSALNTRKAGLEAKLADLQAQRAAMIARAKLPSGLDMPEDWSDEQKSKSALAGANAVIKEHIALLHSYNEMKDIGQGLMGLVADKRGVRVAVIMEEFGVDAKD